PAASISADDIVLVTGKAFTNNAGPNALQPGSGRWLLWSQNPINDALNGLGYNFKQYDATYGVSAVAGSGNGVLYTLAPTLTVGLAGTTSKVYDANTLATIGPGNYHVSGLRPADTA